MFFTKGCNFSCPYCHNPELIPHGSDGNISYERLDAILRHAQDNWIDGVCISGGEPTLQKELPRTIAFIKERSFAIKLDTQGSLPEVLSRIAPDCDYIAMDYKVPASEYPALAGSGEMASAVNRSVEILRSRDMAYELRTTVVPGIHTENTIRRMAEELKGIRKYVLQTFVPRDNLPDIELRTRERTAREQLEVYAAICRNYIEDVSVR